MKKIFTLIVLLSFGFQSWGQTTLPLSRTIWTGADPTGWTHNSTGQYTSSFACGDNDMAKLDNTADWEKVYFDSDPKDVSYHVKPASFGATSVFKVQESIDDITWTDVATYTGIGDMGSCTTLKTDNLLATSRYVRFYYEDDNGGNVGLDDVTITKLVVMPVTINHFNVNKSHHTNLISWATSSEINNSHFNIQHSKNGYSFITIGNVEGSGNSYRLNKYSFTHDTPSLNVNYYRLQQVDFDGSISYSDIIQETLSIRNNKDQYRILSNKVTNQIQFQLDSDNAEFTLLNVNGQLVIQESITRNSSIDVSFLQKGMYIARINSNGVISAEKVLIQ